MKLLSSLTLFISKPWVYWFNHGCYHLYTIAIYVAIGIFPHHTTVSIFLHLHHQFYPHDTSCLYLLFTYISPPSLPLWYHYFHFHIEPCHCLYRPFIPPPTFFSVPYPLCKSVVTVPLCDTVFTFPYLHWILHIHTTETISIIYTLIPPILLLCCCWSILIHKERWWSGQRLW